MMSVPLVSRTNGRAIYVASEEIHSCFFRRSETPLLEIEEQGMNTFSDADMLVLSSVAHCLLI
jgi:hypothetical protein